MLLLLKKLLATLTALSAMLFPASPKLGDTTATKIVPLQCSAAYTLDIYDTVDGLLDAGYYDPRYQHEMASSGPLIAAKVIGTQAYERCVDAAGKASSFPISSTELDQFNASQAPLTAQSETIAI